MVPTLAATWPVTVLATVFVIVCVLMMLMILIQKPRGGGLSAAFGGGGGSAQSAFGAKTGDFLTWFTVAMFVCFVFLAMGMQWAINAERAPDEPSTTTTAPAQQDGAAPAASAATDTQPVAETETETEPSSTANIDGSPKPDVAPSADSANAPPDAEVAP